MTVLVTGGAGYIGSHTTFQLIENGYDVVVIDNFYSGHGANLHPQARFYEGNFEDLELLEEIFNENKIEAIFHFAAYTDVAESVEKPEKYFINNFENTKKLVNFSKKRNIKYFVFSSTAAVYGDVKTNPVTELATTQPVSPYGRSKLEAEKFIQESGLISLTLRYFNVAGARQDGRLKLSHQNNQKHLFKTICEVISNKREFVPVFGNDYHTKDGTGVRDYIHVEDLACAHLNSFELIRLTNTSELFNCGYGSGFSVLEVIQTMENVIRRKIPYKILPRRVGDSAEVFSDSSKLYKLSQWVPRYNNLEIICESALQSSQGLRP